MGDIWKKFKGRILAGLAVLAMGGALLASGQEVDWGQILQDAFKGEVTETAQQLEDGAGATGE